MEENSENKFSYGAKTVYLRFINCIQIIVLVIMGLISFSKDQIVTGILYIVIGVVLLFFIKGFSDIIDLLDNINNKINQ